MSKQLVQSMVCKQMTPFFADVVQVDCAQNSITARIQKQVVQTANYEMEDVHLNDRSCAFDFEDEEFYMKTFSPLTSCGTHFEVKSDKIEKKVTTFVKILAVKWSTKGKSFPFVCCHFQHHIELI